MSRSLAARRHGERIRADRATGDVPIVVLSSMGSGRSGLPEDVELAAILSKPVKEAQLLEIVARSHWREPTTFAGGMFFASLPYSARDSTPRGVAYHSLYAFSAGSSAYS